MEKEIRNDDGCAYDVLIEKYGYKECKNRDDDDGEVEVVNGIVNMTEEVRSLTDVRGRKMY